VCGWANSEALLGKDTLSILVFRKGYVNEKGLFVIVQGAGSLW